MKHPKTFLEDAQELHDSVVELFHAILKSLEPIIVPMLNALAWMIEKLTRLVDK